MVNKIFGVSTKKIGPLYLKIKPHKYFYNFFDNYFIGKSIIISYRIIKYPGKTLMFLFYYIKNISWFINHKKEKIFINFDDAIFLDVYDNRYQYMFLKTLIKSGYVVYYYSKKNILFTEFILSKKTYYNQKYLLKNVVFVNKQPVTPPNYIYMTNTDSFKNLNWGKKIFINVNISDIHYSQNSMVMNYIMHPFQYKYGPNKKLTKLRKINRKIKIFFAGGVNLDWYGDELPNNKSNRKKLFDSVSGMGHTINVKSIEHYRAIKKINVINKVILINRDDCNIKDKHWLENIAISHFFLALPGGMPISHNIIEALSVGTIPILNYPEWFHPSLTHKVNCLTFKSEDEMKNRIEEAILMPKSDIERMKENAIKYYKKHLDPSYIKRKISNHPSKSFTIYYNTDQPSITKYIRRESLIKSDLLSDYY
jgi:hypothetical protein